MIDLVERLRNGIIEHAKRWSGDTHADLGGSVDYDATTNLMHEAADRIAELEAALYRCMIGGNHLVAWLPEPCQPVETEPLDALEQIGAGAKYDMWCCWRAIMQARAALGITSAE